MDHGGEIPGKRDGLSSLRRAHAEVGSGAPVGYTAPVMSLSQKQKKFLKGLAHHLDPVVQVGKDGLSDAVVRQVSQQLDIHELIKVQVPAGPERKQDARRLAEETSSDLVQVIGRMAVLFRPDPEEPRIKLPG